ncbi:MAG: T9SS type A sorting domain-containing protein [Bacteroidia bacterium]
MKKLLLSILMMAGVSAMSQSLSIRLTEPASGTINSGEQVTYTYYVKNISSATVVSGTQFGIGFGTVNNQGQYVAFSNALPKSLTADLAVGDSVMFTQNFALTIPEGTNQQSFICMAIYSISGSQAAFQGASCRVYTLFSSLTEIEIAAQSLSVYPNPASEIINFSIDYNKATTVQMMDITGRVIETVNFNMNNAQVDVRNYNAGVYLYQVLNNEGQVVKTGKVNVNN